MTHLNSLYMGDFVFMFYDDSVKSLKCPHLYSNLLHLQDCDLVNLGPNLGLESVHTMGRRAITSYWNLQSGALDGHKQPGCTWWTVEESLIC